MRTYAVMVVLDLDVTIAYGEKKSTSEIEITTKDRVREALETRTRGTKVKMIRTKFLGLVEDLSEKLKAVEKRKPGAYKIIGAVSGFGEKRVKEIAEGSEMTAVERVVLEGLAEMEG